MTETPQNPDPDSAPLPAEDIGDDRGAIPGVGPTTPGEVPPEGAGDETGGPDVQLAPDKD